jgi:MFS family permease
MKYPLSSHTSADKKTLWGIPTSLWCLSLGMFLLNCSSVLIFTCLPFLAFKKSSIGRLEGTVEGLSLICRAASGLLSDVVRQRKRFLLIGYFICAISRLLMAFASGFQWIAMLRVTEKIGNGVQASPREALIGDIAPPSALGKFYGINKALGMLGSTLGSTALIIIFFFLGDLVTFYHIFFFSGVLACGSFFMLLWGVKEAPPPETLAKNKTTSQVWQTMLDDLRQLPWNFWKVISCIFFLKMGYFSGAFMMTFASIHNITDFLGFPLHHPGQLGAMIMTLQNVISALCSYPLGRLSDCGDRRKMVLACNILLLGSMFAFGIFGASQWGMLLGVLLYGLQYSLQGALMAFLSSTMPAHLQGTGFGVFFLTSGVAIIISNTFIMGMIWDMYSPNVAFLAVCVPVLISILILPWVHVKKVTTPQC